MQAGTTRANRQIFVRRRLPDGRVFQRQFLEYDLLRQDYPLAPAGTRAESTGRCGLCRWDWRPKSATRRRTPFWAVTICDRKTVKADQQDGFEIHSRGRSVSSDLHSLRPSRLIDRDVDAAFQRNELQLIRLRARTMHGGGFSGRRRTSPPAAARLPSRAAAAPGRSPPRPGD